MCEIIPNIEKNFWVKCMEVLIESVLHRNIVITDCRFENEINMVRKYGGYVFRISRENKTNSEEDLHSSEKEMENFCVDNDIVNNSTKEELFLQIDKIIEKMF